VFPGAFIVFALAGAPVVEQWQAPRGCPDRDEMQARLAEVGGGDGLRVRGHIVELGGGLRLELSLGWGGAADRRVFVARDCEVLSESTMLLVGVKSDPVLAPVVREAPPPPPADLPEARPSLALPNAPPPSAVASPAPTARTSDGPSMSVTRVSLRDERSVPRRSSPYVRATVGLGHAAVAPVGIPLRLTLGWAWTYVRIAVRATYWPPRRPRAPLPDGRGGVVQLGTMGPQLCLRPRLGTFEFPQCVHLGLGGNRIDGRGPNTTSAGGFWLDLGVSTGFVWTFFQQDRVELGAVLEIAGEAPVLSTGFRLDGTTYFVPGSIIASGTLGFEARFTRRKAP